MDPELQKVLLQDPRVQAAVKKAGQDALSDPAVQQTIMTTCKEKFPQYAAYSASLVAEWAQDPEVQRQACEYAGVAVLYAGQAGRYVGEQFVGLIEQGPAGLRILAFCGGAACIALAGRTVVNPLALTFGPLMYILSLYLVAFSFTTMLFEMEEAWIAQLGFLNGYQQLVMEKAKFLSEAHGRGLVYMFQGTLWLSLYSSIASPLELLMGVYFLGLAWLHFLMGWGIMPQTVAAKVREGSAAAAKGYVQLPQLPLAAAQSLPGFEAPPPQPGPKEQGPKSAIKFLRASSKEAVGALKRLGGSSSPSQPLGALKEEDPKRYPSEKAPGYLPMSAPKKSAPQEELYKSSSLVGAPLGPVQSGAEFVESQKQAKQSCCTTM